MDGAADRIDEREAAKRAAGTSAAQLVEDGMTVGLGTGSTVRWFVDALIERVAQGLHCSGVATSEATARRAQAGGIEIVDLSRDRLPLAVDGADAVDPQLRLIKGGGGAQVRERIVAAAASLFVVIIDEGKLVPVLGGRLPIEILAFGSEHTLEAIGEITGGPVSVRLDAEGPRLSDSGNLLVDALLGPIAAPEALAARLNAVPGLVGHGLFLGMAGRLLVGAADGSVRQIDPPT